MPITSRGCSLDVMFFMYKVRDIGLPKKDTLYYHLSTRTISFIQYIGLTKYTYKSPYTPL